MRPKRASLKVRASLLTAAFCVLPVALSQSTNTIFGSGYLRPVPISIAPGQIVNLFVQGIGSNLTGPVAAVGLPLPTSLAGISVALQAPFPAPSGPVPIFAVQPIFTCVNQPTSVCARYVAISVQIPFELALAGGNAHPRLTVEENGASGGQLEAFLQSDQVHIVTGCDIGATAVISCSAPPSITHADGTLVTETSPAKPGEQLVMYAVGLGNTSPSVATGHATPSPAPMTRQQFQLNLDYRPNAGPSNCSTPAVCPLVQPIFSGLTPGFAGLYQINFIVPAPPPGTPACSSNPPPLPGAKAPRIDSNLTVSLIGLSSFDGGAICVDTTGNKDS